MKQENQEGIQMSKTAVINVKQRSEMTKSDKKDLTNQGYILGNINGKGKDSVPVAVKKDELRAALRTHGRNSVFKLVSDNDKSFNVMVKDIQVSPMLYEYHHVDFQQVVLNKELKSSISVQFEGVDILESRHFLLNRHLDSVMVSGLPGDMPDHLTIDVSTLKAGDNIKVGDLTYPKGITPEVDKNTTVISISEGKVREAVEATEES